MSRTSATVYTIECDRCKAKVSTSGKLPQDWTCVYTEMRCVDASGNNDTQTKSVDLCGQCGFGLHAWTNGALLP